MYFMADIDSDFELTWFERLFVAPLFVASMVCMVYAMIGWIPILVCKAAEKPYEAFVSMEKWSVIGGVAAVVVCVVGCFLYTWIEKICRKRKYGKNCDEN